MWKIWRISHLQKPRWTCYLRCKIVWWINWSNLQIKRIMYFIYGNGLRNFSTILHLRQWNMTHTKCRLIRPTVEEKKNLRNASRFICDWDHWKWSNILICHFVSYQIIFFPGVEQRIGKGVCSMVGLNSLTYPSEVTLFRVKNESSFSLERPLSLWKSVFNLKDPFTLKAVSTWQSHALQM